MSDSLDLDAYFARIGYDGPRTPTLETLRAIHAAHPLAIPFENLDVLLRRPVRLDIASLQAKLVRGGRGGYCFEQNGLLLAVLRALGFETAGLLARVRWMLPADAAPTARSHMLLRVELPEGTYLADVGFGGLVATAPLLLEAGLEQPTPHETLRLVRHGDLYAVEGRLAEGWAETYRFTLEEQFPADYEQANWWTSAWPASLFVSNLVVAGTRPGRRLNLLNGELAVRTPGQSAERRRIETRAELADVLSRDFAINLDGIDLESLEIPGWTSP